MLCPRNRRAKAPGRSIEPVGALGFVGPALPSPLLGKGRRRGLLQPRTIARCSDAPYTDNAAITARWRHFTVTQTAPAVWATAGGRGNLLEVKDYFLPPQHLCYAQLSSAAIYHSPKPSEAARGRVADWIETPSLARSSGVRSSTNKHEVPVLKGPQVRPWRPRTREPSWS
jgi:hypothetical protein